MPNLSDMPTDLVATSDAADYLGIDRSTLSRWVTAGRITPAIRTSPRGPMLFDQSDLDALREEVDAA